MNTKNIEIPAKAYIRNEYHGTLSNGYSGKISFSSYDKYKSIEDVINSNRSVYGCPYSGTIGLESDEKISDKTQHYTEEQMNEAGFFKLVSYRAFTTIEYWNEEVKL